MGEISAMVQRLLDATRRYQIDEGRVLPGVGARRRTSVAGFPPVVLQLAGERGGDQSSQAKKDPLDRALLARRAAGEPAWDSLARSRAAGVACRRCCAIAMNRLGPRLDVQGRWIGPGFFFFFPHHGYHGGTRQVATGAWPYATASVPAEG
jgi:L-cysteine:1D-myo-inositol 2-amino-2-deoxy-alpha-D-glucopyranoside ligase